MVRVSAVEKERYSLNRPVHFVTYFYLFQYHQQLMSCGTSQNAYHDAGEKMNSMLGQGQSFLSRVCSLTACWSVRKCKKCKKSTFIGHTDKKCGFLRWRLMAGPHQLTRRFGLYAPRKQGYGWRNIICTQLLWEASLQLCEPEKERGGNFEKFQILKTLWRTCRYSRHSCIDDHL